MGTRYYKWYDEFTPESDKNNENMVSVPEWVIVSSKLTDRQSIFLVFCISSLGDKGIDLGKLQKETGLSEEECVFRMKELEELGFIKNDIICNPGEK